MISRRTILALSIISALVLQVLFLWMAPLITMLESDRLVDFLFDKFLRIRIFDIFISCFKNHNHLGFLSIKIIPVNDTFNL